MFIGITTRIIMDEDFPDMRKYYINEFYLRRIKDMGYYPLLLTRDNTDKTLLSLCSGFIISGGADINPKIYHEEENGAKDYKDELDELDSIVLDYAIQNDKAVFGICRGLQFINAKLGGSLYQDMKGHEFSTHNVTRVIDTTLSLNLPSEFSVNSLHHQAIKDLSNEFVVTYISNDNYPELIEHKTKKIFAVQWHPEMLEDSLETKVLFNHFKKLMEM